MNIPTPDEVASHARYSFDQMMSFARVEYIFPNMAAKLRIVDSRTANHHARRVTDKYGDLKHYEVKLNAYYVTRYPLLGVSEYQSLLRNKAIGSFATDDWRLWLDTVLAHEVAHIVEMYFKYHGLDHPDRIDYGNFRTHGRLDDKHHGKFFMGVYYKMRQEFINHRKGTGVLNGSAEFKIDDIEARIAAMPDTPLKGIKFKIRGETYEVVGLNPNTSRRLSKYQLKCLRDGQYYATKLMTIVCNSPAALALVKHHPELGLEFLAHNQDIEAKKAANQKSSETKKARRFIRR